MFHDDSIKYFTRNPTASSWKNHAAHDMISRLFPNAIPWGIILQDRLSIVNTLIVRLIAPII